MIEKAIRVLHLAYGGMGAPVFETLVRDRRFRVEAIVTPRADAYFYRSAADLPHEIRARALGIEIISTEDLDELHKTIKRIAPDLVVIASFCKIIPERTLRLTKFINIHHGNLPRQRGRANINWAIINDEPSVTVSIHEAAPELDAGRIIRQFHYPIDSDDDVTSIYGKINASLSASLADVCYDYLNDKLSLQDQDHSHATYYVTRLPQDGLIDWSLPRQRIINMVRALTKPFPGAYTFLNGKKLVIWKVRIPERDRVFEGIVPGRISFHKKGVGVEVLTGNGPLLLTDVETDGFHGDPARIIKSSKITLGVSIEGLLSRIEDMERRLLALSRQDKPPVYRNTHKPQKL